MFHALYIAAFLILTVIAVSNLVRNMMLLGSDARRQTRTAGAAGTTSQPSASHPEMLDEAGKVTKEPLLVMRSISLQDARQQLEALYDGNPTATDETVDEQE
jgi:hypothetical protein